MSNRPRFCALCSRPLVPDTKAHACPACVKDTRLLLAAIRAEVPELQECLALGAAPAGGRSAGRAHAPLPVRLDALNLLGPGTATPWTDTVGDQVAGIPLSSVLRWWANHIAFTQVAAWRHKGTQYSGPCWGAITHGRDAAAWCRWLDAYLWIAVDDPMIWQLHGDLTEALAAVREITRSQPQRHSRLAPCPACDAIAMVAVDGKWEIKCEVCGHRMDPDEYDAHAAAVLPKLTTTALWIAAVEHTEDTPPVDEDTVSKRRPLLGPCPRCHERAMAASKREEHVVCEACGLRTDAAAYAAYVTAVLPALTTIDARGAAGRAAGTSPTPPMEMSA